MVSHKVTPCAGVWIEIKCHNLQIYPLYKSLPVRECGLKSGNFWSGASAPCVTPCAGVWIEILSTLMTQFPRFGHSLCGSVD